MYCPDDLFSPDAISYLVDGAETHALLEAWMDAGYINIFNKIFQFLIEQAHSTTGLSWYVVPLFLLLDCYAVPELSVALKTLCSKTNALTCNDTPYNA